MPQGLPQGHLLRRPVVNKTCYKYVQESCMKKQLVRLGHWECKEVTPLFGGGGGLFSGHGCCSSGCGDSCGSSRHPALATRTKKVWVHCPEYQECPVTVCKKVPYCEQVHCKVAVCKNEWREEKVKVCNYKCVQETCVEKVTLLRTPPGCLQSHSHGSRLRAARGMRDLLQAGSPHRVPPGSVRSGLHQQLLEQLLRA